MAKSRVNKSIKNTTHGIIGNLVVVLINFVSRAVFIRYLGTEYNGLNSLFTNILNVLNIAELGFSSAVAYALYRPLSDNDEKTVAMIMNYLKKIYFIVAVVVTVAGLLCIPFLEYLINEPLEELTFSLNQLRLYFFLYLCSTICSYLMAHKRTIITADQNNYVITNADNVARFILHILQIILLIITRNYIAYLVLRIAQAFFTNLVLTIYANKKYPYINQTKETISKDLQKPIMKNVGALLFHKVGWVAVSGTTTIIISSFVGIVSAGMYGNYTLVTAGVTTFVALIFTSLIASIGNLCSVSEQDIQEKVFKKIDYISNWISFFCFICFVCLFTPFIALWIGEENIFSMPITIAISLSAVVAFLRKSLVSFKDAKGMFWNDRYKPIAVAIVGIALAVGLSYVWGVFGIIIGYTLANLLIALPVEAYVVYKHGFNMSCVPVLLKKLLIIIFALVSCVIVYFVCSLITIGGIWGFAIQVLICLILPNIFFFLATFWTDEFKYFKSLAFSLIHKILKRKKTVDKDIAKANQSQENDVEKVEIQEHNDDTQLKPNASQECECEKCEEEQNPNK